MYIHYVEVSFPVHLPPLPGEPHDLFFLKILFGITKQYHLCRAYILFNSLCKPLIGGLWTGEGHDFGQGTREYLTVLELDTLRTHIDALSTHIL